MKINLAERFAQNLLALSCALLLFCGAHATPSHARQASAAATKPGTLKGKVRAENGAGVAGATVTAQQGERAVASATTEKDGDFRIDLPAGTYTLVFRKTGLRVGTMQNVEVLAGKARTLRDRLILPVDEGSLALVSGSVFDPAGRSVAGAQVELARVAADGRARRIDDKFSDSTGVFAFRVAPEAATYRVTVRRAGADAVTKEVAVDGAMVYRVAVTLRPREQN